MADKVEADPVAAETKVEKVVVAATPVVAAEPDEFADAFNEANKVGEKADLTAADDPAKMKEEPPIKTPPVTPPVITPPVTPPVTPPASEQQPGESDEKYEQRYKTLQGIHKHDKETWESERTKLLSDLEEAKKPKTPAEIKPPTKAETIAAEAFVDSLTPEQQKQLDDYEKDFDVVSKMEGIKRKAELGKLRKEMMDTISTWKDEFTSKLTEQETNLTSRIAPAVKLVEANDQDAHFDTIREGYDLEDGTHIPGHGDFEKYRDDGSISAWIEAKPRYMQPALKETYEKGTAVDLVDLITDFKKESNIPLTPIPSTDNVIHIDPKKAAKKQALTKVDTRPAAVSTAAALSDDFEGAFDEAVHK